ncbi:DUF1616 domain-containing protein [Chloroflexota bacterium]
MSVLTIILVIVIALIPSGVLRIVLGLPLVLFIPGYTLVSALLPARSSLGGVERVTLSFGLSIAIAILIGVILNFTPWGISIYPTIIFFALFVLITALIAWYRRGKLPPPERLNPTVSLGVPKWWRIGGFHRALSLSLIVAILIALGCLGYVIAQPTKSEGFTEFYLLGIDGKAENYPTKVELGKTAELIVGVVNHERETTSYRIDIIMGDSEVGLVRTAALSDREKWEMVVSLTPPEAGANQRAEFWLYRDGENKPYFEDPLYLNLEVVEPDTS